MDSKLLLAFVLLWGLQVDCQTFPYVSVRGNTVPNHGYVNLGQVGTSPFNRVQCHTNLSTCCRSQEGRYRGQWYFPNGDALQSQSRGSDIYYSGGNMRVDLHRNNTAVSPTGIYRCEIPIIKASGTTVRATVYVGLYTSRGKHYHVSNAFTYCGYWFTISNIICYCKTFLH